MQASASTLHLSEVTHKTGGIAMAVDKAWEKCFWNGALADPITMGIYYWWCGREILPRTLQQNSYRFLASRGLR